MKKYFIAETDEELQFGDKIKLDLTKKTKVGVHKVEGEMEFSEASLPLMLEMGIVEEREVEEEEENTSEEDLLDFVEDGPCEVLEALEEDFEALEKRVDKLEDLTLGVLKEMTTLIKELIGEKKEKEGKKSTQSKKHHE